MAINISRDDEYRVTYTSIDRKFEGGSNDMSCVVLTCKLEISGVFYIFNNSFGLIRFHVVTKTGDRIHQSIEDSKAVGMICHALHSNINSTYMAILHFYNSFLAITITGVFRT